MKKIAVIRTDFPEKFGIPRQFGRVKSRGVIEFSGEYSNPDAVRGLEGFSHIWVIWEFSKAKQEKFSPTVRPPRLGGNKRVGVFASRSPFRPNPIGLSALKLIEIITDEKGVRLIVEGADMVDGTPIYDIKPYVPHCDSIPYAVGGFSDEVKENYLKADISLFPDFPHREELISVLEEDPRPSYHEDGRSYTFSYKEYEITFEVENNIIKVTDIK
jgi:tRNA-Thr(GGU) m(6)t(6)A37 methyltransferase TsaA